MHIRSKHWGCMPVQGISCSEGQCGEVMLKDSQPDRLQPSEVFKCVGCGNTVDGRSVNGGAPLDVEIQADRMYNHAVGVLQQQVRALRQILLLCSSVL